MSERLNDQREEEIRLRRSNVENLGLAQTLIDNNEPNNALTYSNDVRVLLSEIDALRELLDGLRVIEGGRSKDLLLAQEEYWRSQKIRNERHRLREALRLVLPLARGYAVENRVGSNADYIQEAEDALAVKEHEKATDAELGNLGLHMPLIRWMLRERNREARIRMIDGRGWVIALTEPIFGSTGEREVVVEAGEVRVADAIEQALATWQRDIEGGD